MTRDLIAAALYLVPTLLFTEIAREQWDFRLGQKPRSRALRLIPLVSTVLALHYGLLVARSLMPDRIHDPVAMIRTPWHVLFEDPWLVALALIRHLLYLLPLPERRPSHAWLTTNYGIAIGTAAVSGFLRLRPGSTGDQQELAHHFFELGFTLLAALCLHEFVRGARPGRWRPEYAGELRRPDVVLVQGLIAAGMLATPIVWVAGGGDFSLVAFEVFIGLAIGAPMASRVLGHIVPALIVTSKLLVSTIAIFVGYTYALGYVDPRYHALLGFGAVVATFALFGLGHGWLLGATRRLVLRRREREMQELQRFLQTLSPELGVVECARRVLTELVRVRGLSGAAIVFTEGEPLVAGDFDIDTILRVWPRGQAALALPRGAYGSSHQRDLPLPLREAIFEASVGLGLAAIDSPRRRWGHLFLRTGFLGGIYREDDVEAFVGLVDQLALLLDGADLLARTVAVERSLAHSEKLAAIGELAARFAHEIRNPITAARSLAQQLQSDPASPLNAEHAGIIIEELERVERQVRDLLRFARREDLDLAPLDMGALVRATARDLERRLSETGIALSLEAPAGIVARGDREKLRQVLVNLVENAIDALSGRPAGKHLGLTVAVVDHTAVLRVADDGPGIPPEAQAHIFEPFVSLKPSGTGLGLAIAKRTVDAHAGTLAVASRPGATTFEIRLPLATEAAA